ncbi:MAG: c-type cytochrome [Sandaracinus sp.]|nr:c-type cytochrome [Sandaracinus sp.]
MAELKEKRVDEIQGEILHVYDGIEEADNELPNWWLWTFYGAIVFAVFYWFAYHEFESVPLPGQAYAIALQERSGGEVSEDLLVAMAGNPEAVSAGQALFAANCAVCHKDQGEGNIGPNLTDAFWIHGGSPVDIHHTISEGALQNGMPAWGGPLGAEKVQQLTAFVLSIRDTNVAGKEPQGERWVPGAASGDAPSEAAPEEAAPEEAAEEAAAEGAPEEAGEAPEAAEAAEAAGDENAAPAGDAVAPSDEADRG